MTGRVHCLQDMESSNEPVSPFDPYEHVANLTLHEESPLKALEERSNPPEYKPRNSTSTASARGRLEGHDDSSSVSYNGKLQVSVNSLVHLSSMPKVHLFQLRYSIYRPIY